MAPSSTYQRKTITTTETTTPDLTEKFGDVATYLLQRTDRTVAEGRDSMATRRALRNLRAFMTADSLLRLVNDL